MYKIKTLLFIVVALLVLVLLPNRDLAKTADISIKKSVVNSSLLIGDLESNIENHECEAYLGDPSDPEYTAYWIQQALNFIRYAAIIALLIMSSTDYIKAIVSQDNDALKKANITFFKRLAYCILIFFAPTLIKFILTFLGAYGTCGVK